ncbi:conserved hypothetical protein [Neospora caninum Liverpool]|uniref:Transmembrane protein n=1 Tax=Neospora caninum (strain Liverpool) TaxID=572307 RepID=F0VL00_NEOCL|nr:conserved hypothetical protein [Neospora caninum Liverpool]CBZ54752.1 conserved hypothetical protein [Neospora caninum Liverpool]CEL69469.1 TPA: hypothetical protein BN1204_051780 [Neospora caninum Liverpool]|eukprot:XP_003884780.1 conserved hypothetical protein [Neospora caninum Liverpool]
MSRSTSSGDAAARSALGASPSGSEVDRLPFLPSSFSPYSVLREPARGVLNAARLAPFPSHKSTSSLSRLRPRLASPSAARQAAVDLPSSSAASSASSAAPSSPYFAGCVPRVHETSSQDQFPIGTGNADCPRRTQSTAQPSVPSECDPWRNSSHFPPQVVQNCLLPLSSSSSPSPYPSSSVASLSQSRGHAVQHVAAQASSRESEPESAVRTVGVRRVSSRCGLATQTGASDSSESGESPLLGNACDAFAFSMSRKEEARHSRLGPPVPSSCQFPDAGTPPISHARRTDIPPASSVTFAYSESHPHVAWLFSTPAPSSLPARSSFAIGPSSHSPFLPRGFGQSPQTDEIAPTVRYSVATAVAEAECEQKNHRDFERECDAAHDTCPRFHVSTDTKTTSFPTASASPSFSPVSTFSFPSSLSHAAFVSSAWGLREELQGDVGAYQQTRDTGEKGPGGSGFLDTEEATVCRGRRPSTCEAVCTPAREVHLVEDTSGSPPAVKLRRSARLQELYAKTKRERSSPDDWLARPPSSALPLYANADVSPAVSCPQKTPLDQPSLSRKRPSLEREPRLRAAQCRPSSPPPSLPEKGPRLKLGGGVVAPGLDQARAGVEEASSAAARRTVLMHCGVEAGGRRPDGEEAGKRSAESEGAQPSRADGAACLFSPEDPTLDDRIDTEERKREGRGVRSSNAFTVRRDERVVDIVTDCSPETHGRLRGHRHELLHALAAGKANASETATAFASSFTSLFPGSGGKTRAVSAQRRVSLGPLRDEQGQETVRRHGEKEAIETIRSPLFVTSVDDVFRTKGDIPASLSAGRNEGQTVSFAGSKGQGEAGPAGREPAAAPSTCVSLVSHAFSSRSLKLREETRVPASRASSPSSSCHVGCTPAADGGFSGEGPHRGLSRLSSTSSRLLASGSFVPGSSAWSPCGFPAYPASPSFHQTLRQPARRQEGRDDGNCDLERRRVSRGEECPEAASGHVRRELCELAVPGTETRGRREKEAKEMNFLRRTVLGIVLFCLLRRLLLAWLWPSGHGPPPDAFSLSSPDEGDARFRRLMETLAAEFPQHRHRFLPETSSYSAHAFSPLAVAGPGTTQGSGSWISLLSSLLSRFSSRGHSLRLSLFNEFTREERREERRPLYSEDAPYLIETADLESTKAESASVTSFFSRIVSALWRPPYGFSPAISASLPLPIPSRGDAATRLEKETESRETVEPNHSPHYKSWKARSPKTVPLAAVFSLLLFFLRSWGVLLRMVFTWVIAPPFALLFRLLLSLLVRLSLSFFFVAATFLGVGYFLLVHLRGLFAVPPTGRRHPVSPPSPSHRASCSLSFLSHPWSSTSMCTRHAGVFFSAVSGSVPVGERRGGRFVPSALDEPADGGVSAPCSLSFLAASAQLCASAARPLLPVVFSLFSRAVHVVAETQRQGTTGSQGSEEERENAREEEREDEGEEEREDEREEEREGGREGKREGGREGKRENERERGRGYGEVEWAGEEMRREDTERTLRKERNSWRWRVTREEDVFMEEEARASTPTEIPGKVREAEIA